MGMGEGNGYSFIPARGSGKGGLVWTIVIITAIAGFLPLGLGLYYGTAQRNVHFVVGADGLLVEYKVGRISIAAQDIVAVESVPEPPRMGRLNGAGMGDFQMGWYRLPEFGRVYRLTTGRSAYVFVDVAPELRGATSARAATRYVFSPAETEQFVEALDDVRLAAQEEAGSIPRRTLESAPDSASADATTFAPFRGRPVSAWPLAFLGVVIFIPTGIVMPWLLVRGRRTMKYHVGPAGITVEHLGTKRYKWDVITDVSIRDEPLRGLFRTIGAAVPGYFVGRFRARDLGSIQMNATRVKPPLIVVETKTDHVVLTPEDMDGFMSAVAQFQNP